MDSLLLAFSYVLLCISVMILYGCVWYLGKAFDRIDSKTEIIHHNLRELWDVVERLGDDLDNLRSQKG